MSFPVAVTTDDGRVLVPCAECHELTDVYAQTTLHEVRGWVKSRRGGGLHHLLFRETTGRVMCQRCALARQATGSAGQEALL